MAPPSPHPSLTRSGVQVTPVTPADGPAIEAMMRRCSRQTLFQRFHGWTDGLSYARELVSPDGSHETLVARLGPMCVGVAALHRDRERRAREGVAHLGVLVEDAWQRRGIGTQLVVALIGIARRQGVGVVHADVLGENVFLVRALRRIGSATVAIEFGTYTVDIDIRAPSGGRRGRSSGTVPA
jgi:RimJ/RimL family protein N-acetyltransferase